MANTKRLQATLLLLGLNLKSYWAFTRTQVASQLAAAEKAAAKLKAEAARAEVLAGQCQVLNKDLEEAKEGRRLVTVESQKQQGLLEKELQSAGKVRDQLAEQASLPAMYPRLWHMTLSQMHLNSPHVVKCNCCC